MSTRLRHQPMQSAIRCGLLLHSRLSWRTNGVEPPFYFLGGVRSK